MIANYVAGNWSLLFDLYKLYDDKQLSRTELEIEVIKAMINLI